MRFNGSVNKSNKHASYVLYRDEFIVFSHAFIGLSGGVRTSYSLSLNREWKDRKIRLLADDRRIFAALVLYSPALAACGASNGVLV